MKFFRRSWHIWAWLILYAGAALKFSLATIGDEPQVPQWVWWSINAVFIATFLVAMQTWMIAKRLDEDKHGSPPPGDDESVA